MRLFRTREQPADHESRARTARLAAQMDLLLILLTKRGVITNHEANQIRYSPR